LRFQALTTDDTGSKHLSNVGKNLHQATRRNIPEDSHPQISILLNPVDDLYPPPRPPLLFLPEDEGKSIFRSLVILKVLRFLTLKKQTMVEVQKKEGKK
jgi:hypothetical protein